MADKDIIIGHVINVMGMIESCRESYCLPSRLYCSYFGMGLALILQARFTGFGSRIHSESVLSTRHNADQKSGETLESNILRANAK